jgi:hypothetical protein
LDDTDDPVEVAHLERAKPGQHSIRGEARDGARNKCEDGFLTRSWLAGHLVKGGTQPLSILGIYFVRTHSAGSSSVGAESFSTITPALLFGKGFGDLPDDARYLRPFALTGQVGVAVPTRASTSSINDEGEQSIEQHPTTLRWGGSLQYSIPYLQSNVADLGWREPFNRFIPVVEFDLETPLNRGGGGTTGTINPGVLWAGLYVQLGIEAVIPVNNRSGSHTGVIAQLHFFLDDLFPASFGRPLVHR